MNKAQGPPLSGIRVLDHTRVLAGPYCSLLLADQGAEVIKIEPPEGGDTTRGIGPPFIEGMSAYFISVNRNKKSVTLDLRSDRGKEVFYRLVKASDVVLDNFRPKVLADLAIDYNTLRKYNERIITCSISGYGSDGPYRDEPAFDLSIQAMGGGMSITGEPGRAPVRMGLPMGDLAGGMLAAFAITTALLRREKTGRGEYIDLSLLDTQVSLLTYMGQYYLANHVVPGPIGSAHQSIVPYQAFKTKDIYIVIAILAEKFWGKLMKVMGREDIANDHRFLKNRDRLEHRDELIPVLEEIFQTKTGEEWLGLLHREGIPAAPINTLDMVMDDPQVRHRNMVLKINTPSHGTYPIIGNPVKFKSMEKGDFCPPPELGEHNTEILTTLCGLSPDEIRELKKEGII